MMRLPMGCRPVERDEWLSVARSCENATFFHTPYWHELARAARPGYRDCSLSIELPGGRQAIFPLLATGSHARGFYRRVLSTFGGCYGGPLAQGHLSAEDLLRVQRAAIGLRTGTLSIVGNALAPSSVWLPVFRIREMSTQWLELGEPFEALLKRFSKGHKAAYTKGLRNGLQLRRAESERDVDVYFELYQRSLERWGGSASSRYPRELFSAVLSFSLKNPALAAIWLVCRGAENMAGGVAFYWNRHAVYWHGVMDDQFQAESPSNTLVGEMIRDACERGFGFFDFNPSGGHGTVSDFKRRFGTKVVAFERADYTAAALRLVDKLRGKT